jgi:hypothetical protein
MILKIKWNQVPVLQIGVGKYENLKKVRWVNMVSPSHGKEH